MSFSHNNNLSYYVLHPLLLLKHALIEPKTTCTGCPAIKFPLCFHYFLGFHSSKLWKLGVFWKIQEICYKMGTRICKIVQEMSEIIESKVGNPKNSVSRNWAILSHPWNLTLFEDEIFQLFSSSYGSKVPKWNCAHILPWN